MTPLSEALRKRFKTPQEALVALGLDEKLLKDGRAGDDVVVCDSKENVMTKTVLTRKAALVHGALHGYLMPLLAADAQIDVAPMLKGINAKNYKAKKPALAISIQKLTDGKLAQDADLDGMHRFLDSLDDMAGEAEAEAAPVEDDLLTAGEPLDGDEPAGGMDDDPVARVLALLDDKVDSNVLGEIKSILQPRRLRPTTTWKKMSLRTRKTTSSPTRTTTAVPIPALPPLTKRKTR